MSQRINLRRKFKMAKAFRPFFADKTETSVKIKFLLKL